MIENMVMQAEDAFIAKDFLRAASFYAKVVYHFPTTSTVFHLIKDMLGSRYETGSVNRARMSSNFYVSED